MEYIFYDNTGAVKTVDELGGDLNAVLNKLFVLDSLNSPISFGDGWLHDSRTNYYYNVESMAAGQVTTNIKAHSFEEGGTSTGTTKVFAEQTVSGEPVSFLTLANWGGEYGGPIVNGIEIGKFTIELNLEVLQYNEMALMSEWDMSKTFVDDQGNISEIQGDKITLEDGAEIGNGAGPIIFEGTELEAILPNNGGNVSLNGNSFSDKVDLEEITITGNPASKTTVYIGSKAFYNCTKLKMNLTEHENIEYVIASDAFSAGATIKHGGADITSLIVNPSTSGQIAGVGNKWPVATNVYLFLPNTTLTPSDDISLGDYEYTDDQGTWYFDLIDSSGNKVSLNQAQSGGVSTFGASTLATSTDYVAYINQCINRVNDITIPALIGTTKIDGQLFKVKRFDFYNLRSIFFYGEKKVESVVVSNGIEIIGHEAFLNETITSITIPESVKTIGDHAFSGCYDLDKFISNGTFTTASNGDLLIRGNTIIAVAPYNLTEVTIPDNITNIETTVYGETTPFPKTLDKFIANGTYTTASNGDLLMKGNNIVAIAKNNLTKVTIPSGATSIPDNAFYGCTSLTEVNIPDSVTSIGYQSFSNCDSLERLDLPNSITFISNEAFFDSGALKYINIPDGVTSLEGYGDHLWGSGDFPTGLNLYIGSGLTNVKGDWLHESFNVTISENNPYLATNGELFFGKVDDGLEIQRWFYNREITSYEIPSHYTLNGVLLPVKSIACQIRFENLESITIPSTIESIIETAFSYYCSKLDTFIASGTYTTASNGDLLIKGTEIVAFAPYNVTEVTIPDNITSFGSVFKDTEITKITIGNGVTSIGSHAFSSCQSLESITIPDSVTSIGSYAFFYCQSLESITIPNSVTSIGSYAFFYCQSLESIRIPDSVTSIEYNAFQDCTSLKDVTIGNGVTEIPYGCFYRCTALETVTVGTGVTSIGNSAFYNCQNLTTFNWVIEYDLVGVNATVEDQIITSTSASPGSAALADAPTNIESGVSFLGWSDGTKTYQPGDSYPFTLGNRKLTAVWSIAKVSFDANGGEGTIGAISADKSVGVTLPDGSELSRTDYTFLGWSTNKNATTAEYTAGSVVYESMTLYAVWEWSYFNFYIYGYSNDSVKLTFKKGESVTINLADYVNSFTRDGYVICGWEYARTDGYSPDEVELEATITPEAGRSVRARWATKVTVTFDANGGEGSVPEAIVGDSRNGVRVIIPSAELAKGGYVFLGWATYTGATSASYTTGSSASFYSNTVLYAVWVQEYITFTFYGNGGLTSGGDSQITATLRYDAYLNFSDYSSAFIKDGYVVSGWATYPEATSYTYSASTSMQASGVAYTTFYAVWRSSQITITFDMNGGVGENITVTGNFATSADVLFPTAEGMYKEGYKFINWSAYQSLNTMVYVRPGEYGTSLNITFTGDYTFYAGWLGQKTVSFDINGGTGTTPSDMTVYYDYNGSWATDYITFPTADGFSKEGYALAGWSTSSTSTYADIQAGANTSYYEATTYYAVWKEGVNVTFDMNGGEQENKSAYLPQDSWVYINKYVSTPTRFGYYFLGWSTDPNSTSATYSETAQIYPQNVNGGADFTLYAVWEKGIIITLNANGGVGEEERVVIRKYNSLNLRDYQSTFTREGYALLGWSTNSSATSAEYSKTSYYYPSSDSTLYAVWAESITITFNSNGGNEADVITEAAKGQYYYPSITFTRTGYIHIGWHTDPNATNIMYSNQASGFYPENINGGADFTFYAVWAKKINVTFNGNGGITSSGEVDYATVQTNGKAVYLSNYKHTFTREGYGVIGWSETPGATTATYSANTSIWPETINGGADFTLYAVWAKNINVTLDGNGGTTSNGETTYFLGARQQLEYIYFSNYRSNFTLEGHELVGWSTDPNATTETYGAYSSVYPENINGGADVILYAVWQKSSYSIILNGNGGTYNSEEIVSTGAGRGTVFYLNTYSFTREGYALLGWAFEPTSTTAKFGANWCDYPEKINNSEDFTLYAVWIDSNSYAFTISDGNGESVILAVDRTLNPTINLAEYETLFAREGYAVAYWEYARTDGYSPEQVFPGKTITPEEGRSLRAVWGTAIKVTFDMNGGNEENVTVNWAAGYSYTISEFVAQPTRGEYWTFLGWSTSPTATYSSWSHGSSINPTTAVGGNDFTLYAVWQNEKYVEINFYPNGGVGEVVTVQAEKGQGFYLKDYTNIFTREGYQLVGWSTSETATSYSYNITWSGYPEHINWSSTVNFYAFWKSESELVRVEFDLSEVEGQNNYVVYGEVDRSIYGPSVADFRNAQGQAICGWARTQGATDYNYSGSSSIYLNSSYFTAGQTTTLYPVWTNIYTVHFDANGGTGEVPADVETWRDQQVNIGDFELKKDGYTFAGWDQDPNFSYGWPDIRKDDSSYFYGESDITYYAVWAAPVTLTFNANGGEGTVPEQMTVNFMESMTIPTGEGLTKAGYKLVGWDRRTNANYDNCDLRVSNGTQTVVFVSGSYTLYAVWEKLNNEIYFGSLQESQIKAAQGIWAGKDSLTNDELNQLANYADYNMTNFMPTVYFEGLKISQDWDSSNWNYRVRGYAAKITTDTFTVVFPNALPTGWKLLNYRFKEIASGDVTVVDGKAQVEFTHTYMEEATESDKMIFLFTLPSQPAEEVSTQGMIITYPENLWDAVINGTDMGEYSYGYAMTGFTVEIYNADTNAMLWLSTMGERGVTYNFVSGNYKIVISSENVVGVHVANIKDMSELNILENVTYSSANGQTIITFSYTYSKDNPGFGMVVKMASEPLTDAVMIYGMDGAIAQAVKENIIPLVYKAAFAHMGFTCIGTTLTNEEINYAGYIAGLLMEDLMPEDVAFSTILLSGLEIWSENGEIYENPGEYISLAKGKTYTIKSKEYLQSLAMFDFEASECYNCAFTYDEESGLYVTTITVSENASSELVMCFGGENADISTVEGLPEYDENTDYTQNLEALFNS